MVSTSFGQKGRSNPTSCPIRRFSLVVVQLFVRKLMKLISNSGGRWLQPQVAMMWVVPWFGSTEN